MNSTPGPWTVKSSAGSYALYGIKESHERLKAMYEAGGSWVDAQEADMRLVAASPLLYSAALRVIGVFGRGAMARDSVTLTKESPCIEALLSAIETAEGDTK